MARFGKIDLKIRPIKMAFLVDPNKAEQVRKAIQIASTVWAGAYCPIITVYKKLPRNFGGGTNAKDVVLGYVDAFDPDILVQCCKEIPQYLNELGLEIIKVDEIWYKNENFSRLSPKYGIGIFELYNDIFKEFFKYKSKYPIKIIIPKLPKELTLFWASLFGDLQSDFLDIIHSHCSEPLEINEPIINVDEIEEYLKGDVIFPRRVTQHGLKQINRSGFRRSSYIFYMDGQKIEDIIDYWNLRAMGRDVLPLPKQLLLNKSYKNLINSFLKQNRKHWPHNKAIVDSAAIIRSRNSTMNELNDFAVNFDLKPEANDPSNYGFFYLQHWYPRVWDEWARDKDGAIPDDFYGEDQTIEIAESNGLKISFNPLMPQFAYKYVDHIEPRCANEISFKFYGSQEYLAEAILKFSGKNFLRSISSFRAFKNNWRIGRNGLVRLTKDTHNENWEVPESEKIFFAWLKDLGWEPKISTAGLLAKQIYKIFDGHPLTLANEELLKLLEYLSGGKAKIEGKQDQNDLMIFERELPIGEIRNRLSKSNGPNDLCDYLISKGVFRVGIKMQCPNCRRNSWYSFEMMDFKFTCPKCLDIFLAIGNVEKSKWCYRTTGPFSVPNYAEGAYATLLALEFFDTYKLPSLQITPVFNFNAISKDKTEIEADFGLFWQDNSTLERQEGILFGECKTFNHFQKKDFDRMSYLAKSFPGAIIVFSTLRRSLSKTEIQQLLKIAKRGRKYWKNERPINPLLILTGNEILSLDGPPYCWKEAKINYKYDRYQGLLNLCDATQQIYLGLPSWESEWGEKWEKKYTKLRAKEQHLKSNKNSLSSKQND